MDEKLERKLAALMLYLEQLNRRERDFDNFIQQALDHADVSDWLQRCRSRGWGDATFFSLDPRML